MVVHRGILLAWLVLLSLSAVARADEDDPVVARPRRTGSADRTHRPAARLFGKQDAAVRPAKFVAQHPNPDEPLGFGGALVEPSTPVDPPAHPSFFDDEPLPEKREALHESQAPLDPGGPAPATSSGDWLHNGRWYTEQSVVYMSRAVNVKNQVVLAADLASAALTRQQNTLAIVDQAFQPGMRSTIGNFLGRDDRNRDHAIEFTFLGLTHWRAAGGLTAVNPGAIFTVLNFTNTVPAFDGAKSQNYVESSSFDSYELNYRVSRRLSHDQMIYTRDSTWVRQCTPATLPSVFAGVRVVTINEKLGYFSQTVAPVVNGAYRVSTHNSLVGPQIGGDWFYERSEWRFGARGKAGALVNWANQSSDVQITDANGGIVPSIQNRNQHASADILSFVGELNLIGAYQLRPNFALRTSYDLMWATNLALAQNQLTFTITNPASVAGQHSLFFQGFSLGFEYSH
ncbi:MAG: BBP7 family outer membrane beta-barrel protein [Planctomycetia bacterium]|nr:BBP7 family outer membrane beta-barrel protein [Planctomycetia bacterium]